METGRVEQYTSQYRMQMMTGSVKSGSDSQKSAGTTDLNSLILEFKVESFSFSLENITGQSDLFSQFESSKAAPPMDSLQNILGEDGYWGVKKTSGRIADFVLKGAGDDLEKLKAGREGVLSGLEEAEKIWGGSGTLPDISYDTINSALESIDEKIRELGGSVVDISA